MKPGRTPRLRDKPLVLNLATITQATGEESPSTPTESSRADPALIYIRKLFHTLHAFTYLNSVK